MNRAFTMLLRSALARRESSASRQERMRLNNADLIATADRIQFLRLCSLRAATVQGQLHHKAKECRGELIAHVVSFEADGSRDHVTSLGVHLCGIEKASSEILDYVTGVLAQIRELDAQATRLRKVIARDLAACHAANPQ